MIISLVSCNGRSIIEEGMVERYFEYGVLRDCGITTNSSFGITYCKVLVLPGTGSAGEVYPRYCCDVFLGIT